MGILECSNFFLFDRADSVILKQIEKKVSLTQRDQTLSLDGQEFLRDHSYQTNSYKYFSAIRRYNREKVHSRYRPRFFDQVGHENMYAFSGNKHFFTKSCHRQTYQNYEQPPQTSQNS